MSPAARSARRACALVATSLVFAVTATARAAPPPCPAPEGDPTDQARRWFEEALKLEPSAPEDAVERLGCAAALVDRPAVELRLGMLHERLLHYDRAATAYRRYLQLAGDGAPDREALTARIAALDERRASAELAHARTHRRRIAGWIVAGAGAAIGIAGGALLRVAQSDNDAAHAVAPGTMPYDSSEVRGRIDRAQIEQGLGIAAIAVGVLATTAGLGLALAPEAPVSIAASPAGVVARLRF